MHSDLGKFLALHKEADCVIVRFTRVETKEKILRAAREKGQVTHKGKPIRLKQISLRNSTSQKRVGANIQHPQRTEPSAQNFISSQTKLHNWRKNKSFYEQASTQRFYYHQAGLTKTSHRSIIHRNEQPVWALLKIYQKVRSIKIKKNLHQQMDKIAS